MILRAHDFDNSPLKKPVVTPEELMDSISIKFSFKESFKIWREFIANLLLYTSSITFTVGCFLFVFWLSGSTFIQQSGWILFSIFSVVLMFVISPFALHYALIQYKKSCFQKKKDFRCESNLYKPGSPDFRKSGK